MWAYDHIDETRQRLLSKGIMDLGGEINEKMAMYVRDALMILATNDYPAIKVIITSDGGNVTIGLAIYDMLKSYPGKITGVACGFCRSFAMVVLQACDHRLALPHIKIKIHNVLVDIEKLKSEVVLNRGRLDRFMASLAQDVRRDQEYINKIYSRRSGQPPKTIRQLSKSDRELTAKEALKLRLIDRIVEKF
ncbi:MAG: hypothetical protein A3B89_02990 [Candidatus Buchananbacteria bacterium RIFCSPHIGHO2_02_FULL_40_13]|uniref:ATP-dependent Clp protease proteolytic subunit n=1 Tax=Candidatus Buchananbacteria bacterium RIFCSPLOWO2_01_FULL_39_33 TaxID=1797543 RepID=A0A1G1YG62_9BACT|nr:MAG: hypothetical protein A3B89_02990 [Candidatus Buchananbacteria bacterium RIFCSPHIGHO2_02_FULL_40_13]OGY51279.1 MAG: hypothetical protein A3A02_01560 [Candidatus Buchananbacteria bacterium RIFCSPLOWO2_01_FULL_39_33]